MAFNDLRLGTDVVDIRRLRDSYERFGSRYLQHMLTAGEWAYCQRGTAENGENTELLLKRAAGRIAAKEAVVKALGVGINGLGYDGGVSWQSVEVVSEPQQPPKLVLHHQANTLAGQQKIQAWRLSFAHDGDYAVATAIALM